MARGAASDARGLAGFCLRLALAWCLAAQLLVGQAAAAALSGPGHSASAWPICHNNRSEPSPAPVDGTAPVLHACCMPGLCALPLGLAAAGLAVVAPLTAPLKLAAAAESAPAPALHRQLLYARPPPTST